MYVLVAYKDEENQMKNEGPRVVTTLNSNILDAQGQLTLSLVVGCGRKSNSFKLFMNVLGGRSIQLEDLKVLRRSPDLLNNVKIGQG